MNTSARLEAELEALIHTGDDRVLKPMAMLTLRFDGAGLTHVGEAVARAVDIVFEHEQPQWLFGHHAKLAAPQSTARRTYASGFSAVRQPKNLRSKSGLAFLRQRLSEVPSLAAQRGADLAYLVHALNFVAKDGPKPWDEPGSGVPDRAALHRSLGALDDRHSPAGTFSFAFPLAELGDERWLSVGDALFSTLNATAGWLTPALWGIQRTLVRSQNLGITKASLELVNRRFPQVDLPILYSGNCEIFAPPPRGLMMPTWVSWLNDTLAARVHDFAGTRVGSRFVVEAEPPFEMNDGRHERYRQARRAFRDVLLTGDEAHPYFERFAS